MVPIEIISAGLEIVLLNYFFGNYFEYKGNKLLKIIINFLVFAVFISVTLVWSYWLKLPLTPVFTIINLLLFTFVFAGNFWRKLIFVLVFYMVSMLSEILIAIILYWTLQVPIETLQTEPVLYLLGLVLSKLIIIFVLRVIFISKINNKFEFELKTLLPIIFIELSSIMSIYYFCSFAYKYTIVPSNEMIVIIAIIIFANIALFNLLDNIIALQKSKDELISMKAQYKVQTEYYSELRKNQLETNKNIHDTKNFIAAFLAYAQSGNFELAQEKIDEFYGKLPDALNIETGNTAVNALMKTKIGAINDNIPHYKLSISIPDDLLVDEIDLCVFLGNALDNAIEACKKIEEKQQRRLCVEVLPINGQLSIEIENSRPKIPKTEDKLFKTTKSNKLKHGFGIKNMQHIISKYGGNILLDEREESFILCAFFPNFAK
jgi:hypothetical protein